MTSPYLITGPAPANENRNREEPLRCFEVAPVEGDRKVVTVMFSRPLTDGELRFFREVCERSAPLMGEK